MDTPIYNSLAKQYQQQGIDIHHELQFAVYQARKKYTQMMILIFIITLIITVHRIVTWIKYGGFELF